MGLEGLEPSPKNAESTGKTNDAGRDYATNPSTSVDPDLRMVLEAWPHLSDPIRKAILALIGTDE